MRSVGSLAVLILVMAACSAPTAPRPLSSAKRVDAGRKDGAAVTDGAERSSAPDADQSPPVPISGLGDDGGGSAPADGPDVDAGCGPVSRACVGDTLVSCGPDGQSKSMVCAQGCNELTLLCNQCKPNARYCMGSYQVVCKPDGTSSDSTTCTTSCDPNSGECSGCAPSTVWCNGDTLRECTAAGEQRDRQVCSFGCDGIRMACNACKPGGRTCNGDTLLTCKADGSGTTPTTCQNGCNNDRHVCNRCRPNTRQCLGLTTQVCRPDGSGFMDVDGVVDCKKPLGQGCNGAGDCASGFCVRGLCCNTACDGACLSCVAAENAGSNGTCGPARTDTDPHDDCAATGPATCGTDGACDGAGRCRRFGSGTECSAATCTGGREVPAGHCDGQGTCTTMGQPHDCAPFACGPAACLGSCGRDGDCAMGTSCNTGTSKCVPPQGLGATCTNLNQCGSGHCSDGFCCNVQTCDPCKKCGAAGKCELFVPRGQNDVGCASPNVCNGIGTCGPPCAGVQCDGGCLKENGQCLAVADIKTASPCEADLCGRAVTTDCRSHVEAVKVTATSQSDLERACRMGAATLLAKICMAHDVVDATKGGKIVPVELSAVSYDQDGKPTSGGRRVLDHKTCPPGPSN